MIAALVIHLLLVGVLAALAAHFGEQAVRRLRLPVRGVWAAAMAFTVLVPAIGLTRAIGAEVIARKRVAVPVAAGAPGLTSELRADVAPVADAAVFPPTLVVPAGVARLDSALLILWGGASLLALVRLGAAHVRLRRRCDGWAHAEVDGTPVRLSADVGPAVAGVRRAAIVLPDWALDAPPAVVRLMLEHEREHVRARDHWLAFAADLLVALAPWHPALRWQRRRLRLAIEMDCDARVLRVEQDARRYAELLIAVAGRPSSPARGLAAAVALAPRPSTLQRRITAMTEHRQRRPVTALACASAALVVAFAACEAPRPTAPAPEHGVPLAEVARAAGRVEGDSGVLYQREGQAGAREGEEIHLAAGDTTRRILLRGDSTSRVLVRGERRAADPTQQDSLLRLRLRRADAIRDSIAARVQRGEFRMGEPLVIVQGSADTTAGVFHFRELRDESIHPDAIERIEVVKGAAAARVYGVPASGGVITVVRRDPAEIRGESADGRASATPVAGALTERAKAAGPATELNDLDPASRPLVVVDGIILNDPDALGRLVPDEIVTVEVVKGEVARRYYGERGRNGVVLVTTKGR